MKNKLHILLIGIGGVILISIAWAWMAGMFGPYIYEVWAMLLFGIPGLFLISYALFQIHEALLAIFWSGLALALTTWHLLSRAGENIASDLLVIFLLGLPGIGLGIYAFHLYLRRKNA